MIPKALDGWKAQGDERVKELGSELRSLKVLIGNRVGTTNNTTNSTKPAAGVAPASTAFGTVSSGTAKMNTIKFGESASTAPANHSEPNVAVFSPGITTPHPQTGTATPFNFESRSSGRSIPAWQMAAAAKGANTATTAAATTTLAGAGNHVGEGSGQQQQQ